MLALLKRHPKRTVLFGLVTLLLVTTVIVTVTVVLICHSKAPSIADEFNIDSGKESDDGGVDVKAVDEQVRQHFCDELLPQILGGLQANTTVILDSFGLPSYALLLPDCPVTCPAHEEELTALRLEAAQVLQVNDERCCNDLLTYDVAASSGNDGLRIMYVMPLPLDRLYTPLMLARLLSVIKARMFDKRHAGEGVVRSALVAWRSASVLLSMSPDNQRFNMRWRSMTIFDEDSAIRHLLSTTDWLKPAEKTAYIEAYGHGIRGSHPSFLQALSSSAHGNDAWSLAEDVTRWHWLQALPLPKDLRDAILANARSPRNITPLKWFDGNCFMQAALQFLAPVASLLDYEYGLLPLLQQDPGQDNGMTRLLPLLRQCLEIINDGQQQTPFVFRDLHASFPAHLRGTEGDTLAVLRYLLTPNLKRGQAHRQVRSPLTYAAYFYNSSTSDDTTRSQSQECRFYQVRDYWMIDGTCVLCDLVSDLTADLWQAPPIPDSQLAFYTNGPKLLWLKMPHWHPNRKRVPTPTILTWTLSVEKTADDTISPSSSGTAATEKVDVTMRYVLRSAVFNHVGHWSCALHYPRVPLSLVDQDGANSDWFWCNIDECTRWDGMKFPDGVLPDGSGTVGSLLYERVS